MILFSRAGVHPPENKNTADSELVELRKFPLIRIPMQQQIGPGCKPCVKKGDTVTVGQMIGEPIAGMSVPIHSSVSGTVERIAQEVQHNGRMMEVIEIKNDRKFTMSEDIAPPVVDSKESFIEAVRQSGLVGLGGAGFPTHFKLNPPPDKTIDLLIVNGMECEPYITSDDYQMKHYPEEILDGIQHVMQWCQIPQVIIGVEANTPKSNQRMKKLVEERGLSGSVKLIAQKTRYPLGAEKMLIYRLAGRIVPEGGLPHDVGTLVLNVGTCRLIARYLETGVPLIEKIITLDGAAVRVPGNYLVPIGAPIDEVVNLSGGYQKSPAKIIMGGPMMGSAQFSLDVPVLKASNAVLFFSENEDRRVKTPVCIRCGRCIEACPMRLLPTYMYMNATHERWDECEALNVLDCMECGACTYECPGSLHLTQTFCVAKARVMERRKK